MVTKFNLTIFMVDVRKETNFNHTIFVVDVHKVAKLYFKGGTISMPTGRHVDNDFIHGLKTKTYF
jgi:hypothetical protein